MAEMKLLTALFIALQLEFIFEDFTYALYTTELSRKADCLGALLSLLYLSYVVMLVLVG